MSSTTLETRVIPKHRFGESKDLLFAWLRRLDMCTYQNPVWNGVSSDIRESWGDSVIAFVFDGGEPMGFAYANLFENVMFVNYVSCKVRRKGYGSMLMNALEQFARVQGIWRIELTSAVSAQGFYTTHGYIFGSLDSLYRKSLRIARRLDPDTLVPFVKYVC